MIIDEKYRKAFLEEAFELIENLNEVLLKYEKEPDNFDYVDQIFRYIHSIKSEAGLMGYENVSSIAHKMEDIFHIIRDNKIVVNEDVLTVFFQVVDYIGDALTNILNLNKELDIDNDILDNLNIIRRSIDNTLSESDTSKIKDKVIENPEVEEKKRTEQRNEMGKEGEESKGDSEIQQNEESIKIISDDDSEIVKKVSEIDFQEIQKIFKLREFDIDTIQANSSTFNYFCVEVKIMDSSPMKYPRAFLVYNSLNNIGDVILSEPSIEEENDDSLYSKIKFFLKTDLDIDEKSIFEACEVDEIESVIVKKIYFSSVDYDVEIKKEFEKDNEEIIEEQILKEKLEKNLIKEEEKIDSRSKKLKEIKKREVKKKINTIRVELSRLDNIGRLVGELIINRSKISQAIEYLRSGMDKKDVLTYLEEAESELYRITDEVQNNVMQLRMIPVGTIFNKFPRVVRDIARKLNKKIELKIKGADTEIDKKVIEEIQDPITHIIRNAIDHGIELPEERKKIGKPEVGTIELKAFQEGNNIIIEVSDDGKGIEIEKIKKRASQLGLIGEDEQLTESDYYQFLFLPGFSTKEQVTSLSGRGVGLDVVKAQIEKLRGKIELISSKGKGTTIRIILPLTLTIMNVLLVKAANRFFSIPIYTIEQTDRVPLNTIEKLEDFEVLRYRDEIYSVIYLSDIIGQGKVVKNIDNLVYIVLVKFRDKKICLLIDELIGEQGIVLQPLDEIFREMKGISGVAILGDGSISLVLNVYEIVREYVKKHSKVLDIIAKNVDLGEMYDEIIEKYKSSNKTQ